LHRALCDRRGNRFFASAGCRVVDDDVGLAGHISLEIAQQARHFIPNFRLQRPGGPIAPPTFWTVSCRRAPYVAVSGQPQDLKLEIEALSQAEAMGVAEFLANVVGRGHARQMGTSDRREWLAELHKNRSKSLVSIQFAGYRSLKAPNLSDNVRCRVRPQLFGRRICHSYGQMKCNRMGRNTGKEKKMLLARLPYAGKSIPPPASRPMGWTNDPC
jgi:hypothetical protein